MKKTIKVIINLILVLAVAVSFVGCGSTPAEKSGETSVYYINGETDKLAEENYQQRSENVNNQVFALIDALSRPGKEKNHKAAIPAEVTVNGYDIDNGTVTVDFSKSYKQLKNRREVLLRAAVVFTLCELKSINFVKFKVDGKDFEKSSGHKLGKMNASSFVSELRGTEDEYAKADFLLYFGNSDGTKLKAYELKEAKFGNMTKEQFIVTKLINGPESGGYTPTLNKNVKLNSVIISNKICYVDFDESFLSERGGVSDKLMVYSIVNSLSELNGVHEVQITINGSSNNKLHNNMSLREPFIRDLDLVEKE